MNVTFERLTDNYAVCREFKYYRIYALLVLIFLAQKCACAHFYAFCMFFFSIFAGLTFLGIQKAKKTCIEALLCIANIYCYDTIIVFFDPTSKSQLYR